MGDPGDQQAGSGRDSQGVFDRSLYWPSFVLAVVIIALAFSAYVVVALVKDRPLAIGPGVVIAAVISIPFVTFLRSVRKATARTAGRIGLWNGILQTFTTTVLATFLGLLFLDVASTSQATTAAVAGILLVLQPVGAFFAGQRSAMTRAETEATLQSIREIQQDTKKTVDRVASLQQRSEDALASIRALQVRTLSGPLGLELLALQDARAPTEAERALQRLVWLAASSALTDTRLCNCSLWARIPDSADALPGRWIIAATSVPRESDQSFILEPVPPGGEAHGVGILPNLYARVGCREAIWNRDGVRAWSEGDVFLATAGAHRHPWFRPRELSAGEEEVERGPSESLAARLLRNPFTKVVVGAIVLTSPTADEVVWVDPGPERKEMIDILDHWTHTFYWAFHHYTEYPDA